MVPAPMPGLPPPLVEQLHPVLVQLLDRHDVPTVGADRLGFQAAEALSGARKLFLFEQGRSRRDRPVFIQPGTPAHAATAPASWRETRCA